MEKLVRVVSVGVGLVLVAVMALLLASVLPTLLGAHSFVVRSGSMEPTIRTGSVVVARVVDPATLQQGDIITFQSTTQPGVNITHRIVAITGQGGALRIATKGDANAAADIGSVDLSKPVAKARYWLPWAGYLIAYLSLSQAGARLLLVGCGLLILCLRLPVELKVRHPLTTAAPAGATAAREGGR